MFYAQKRFNDCCIMAKNIGHKKYEMLKRLKSTKNLPMLD